MKFIISPEIYTKCTEFSTSSVSTSSDKYARRNQFNVEKIQKDIRNGKLGEEGVYSLLLGKFPKLSAPDHTIYDKNNKSWDPDLKDEDSNKRIAVKSQNIDSALDFGESWVFQYRAGAKYDCDTGIFGTDKSKHFVAFVSLNVPKRIGEIKAIVAVQWLHDNFLFKSMQKESLKSNKVAVYYDDLIKFKDELFQI